jgi:hypothetical protein
MLKMTSSSSRSHIRTYSMIIGAMTIRGCRKWPRETDMAAATAASPASPASQQPPLLPARISLSRYAEGAHRKWYGFPIQNTAETNVGTENYSCTSTRGA